MTKRLALSFVASIALTVLGVQAFAATLRPEPKTIVTVVAHAHRR
jgi:heme/copper-type cytochrome/quinol oxidase subunit 4